MQAWFRELPQGVLDALTPEQVMNCHTEEECVLLVNLLPPSQSALLDWTANLMADVVQEEAHNKMNARNIAMVFAPNMTQVGPASFSLPKKVLRLNCRNQFVIFQHGCRINHWFRVDIWLVETDGRSIDCIDACGSSDEFPENSRTSSVAVSARDDSGERRRQRWQQWGPIIRARDSWWGWWWRSSQQWL